MKGFVPTPEPIVDLMVDKLFRTRPPRSESCLLDPGCGRGAFIDGIMRWCAAHRRPVPRIVGVDSDPRHVAYTRDRFSGARNVRIVEGDFLLDECGAFDYVIGNPPYVSLGALSQSERARYRLDFETATGRFDLYALFFEKALRVLEPHGRLVLITPEKYLYVEAASPLRRLLSGWAIEELHFLDEETFQGLVTYPLITTVTRASDRVVRVIDRDRTCRSIAPLAGATSWLPLVRGASATTAVVRLEDAAVRVSCGVATGADAIFIVRTSELKAPLARFAHPTMAGREIVSTHLPDSRWSLLSPYDREGRLLPERRLGALGEYLAQPYRRQVLASRYCVAAKPWYAFHETPPLRDILRPKILCKDIGSRPIFVVEGEGAIVPRHSLYYIVPAQPERIDELAAYLNSDEADAWLRDHCQRAANGFIRLQSHVLKRLPLPRSLATLVPQTDLDLGQQVLGVT